VLALEIRVAIGALTQKWRKLGYEIGIEICGADNEGSGCATVTYEVTVQ
jgi:hypothetical protein